jgi:hypothetical protein
MALMSRVGAQVKSDASSTSNRSAANISPSLAAEQMKAQLISRNLLARQIANPTGNRFQAHRNRHINT